MMKKPKDHKLNKALHVLTKLDKLRMDGDITDHEYTHHRSKILEKVKNYKEKHFHLHPHKNKDYDWESHAEKPPHHWWFGFKIFLIFFSIIILFIYLKVNDHCVSIPPSSGMFNVDGLLTFIKSNSLEDYDFICNHMSFVSSQNLQARRYTVENIQDKDKRGVILTNDLINRNISYAASVLIHETCHGMQLDVMGGINGLTQKEVERECERMQHMSLFRFGYYKTYPDMVKGLSQEGYGKDWTVRPLFNPGNLKSEKTYFRGYTSIKSFCDLADLSAYGVKIPSQPTKFNVNIKNSGTSLLHCGLIYFSINGLEYPLDCWELKPNQSHLTGKHFILDKDDVVEIKIPGCEGTDIRIDGSFL